MPPLAGTSISILQGLDGQDDYIEHLMALWEQLQLSAVEVAAQPECDLISFAQTAFFFGIITPRGLVQVPIFSQTEKVTTPSQTNTSSSVSAPKPPISHPWDWKPEGAKSTLADELLGELEGPNEFDESNPTWNYGSISDLDDWFSKDQSSCQEQAQPAVEKPLPIFSPTLSSTLVPMNPTLASTSQPIPTASTNPYTTLAPRGLVQDKPLGIIYLVASPFTQSAPNQVGELNLGIILDAAHKGKGYAREAIQLLVNHAFQVERCHRIQASLINLNHGQDGMISLLTQLRFGHEGTRRRAFYHPLVKEWQDMTTLAILDTDWALRSVIRSAPKSLWDEMFLRHQREREELLRWETRSLKRSASTETIRAGGGGADLELGEDTDADSSAATSDSERSSVASFRSNGKRRKVDEDPYDGSSSDYDSIAGSDCDYSDLDSDVVHFDNRAVSPARSESSVESVPPSPASSSEWDILDSSGTDE